MGPLAYGRRLVVKKPAEPGDAEDAVTDLRGHLREARRLEGIGERREAHRLREKAKRGIAAIAAMLEDRFVRKSWRAFGGTRRHLVDDAVGQMFLQLDEELMDLGPENGLYERKFNLAVMYLMIDALRCVAKNSGMRPMKKQDSKEDETADDVEAVRSNNRTPLTPEDLEADGVQRDLGWFIGEDLREKLLAKLPSEEHRKVFLLRMSGTKWKDVVRKTGIPDKTVRRYFKRSQEILRRELLKRR